MVQRYFGDGSKFGVRIHYSIEKELLGSAGAIKKFEPSLDEIFYYIYGDIFSLMDYGNMEKAYFAKSDPIGMQRMKKTDDHGDADIAELDAEGRLIAVHPKPHTERYPNAYRMGGSFILNKAILAYIPEDAALEMGKQLIPAVMNDGKNFYAYESDDYSKAIDTMEKWEEVEEYIKTWQK